MSTPSRPIVKLLAAMREKAEKDLIHDPNDLRCTAEQTLTPIMTRTRRGRPSKWHVTDPACMSEMGTHYIYPSNHTIHPPTPTHPQRERERGVPWTTIFHSAISTSYMHIRLQK